MSYCNGHVLSSNTDRKFQPSETSNIVRNGRDYVLTKYLLIDAMPASRGLLTPTIASIARLVLIIAR